MKITRNQLRRIVNEEIARASRVNEGMGSIIFYLKAVHRALADVYGVSVEEASTLIRSNDDETVDLRMELGFHAGKTRNTSAAVSDLDSYDYEAIKEKIRELQKAGRLPK